MILWLNGNQISCNRTSVPPREAKRRHVGMGDHKAVPQTIDEGLEIQQVLKATKRRGAGVRAVVAGANGMALRAHSRHERMATLGLVELFGLPDGNLGREQQQHNCGSNRHS
jgi:hypothetical protein